MRAANPPDALQRRDFGEVPQRVAHGPFEGPQIGPDQGQRKESNPRWARQICHVLPRGLEMAADLGM